MKKNRLNIKPFLIIAVVMTTTIMSCKKKEGCTDPTSLNYNPDAKKDDGSCTYAPNNPSETKVTVKDDGSGTGTTTWTADKEYILDGFVFVNSGQTLTIEPGTIIKGKPGQGSGASALLVARGGKLIAEGTASKPIIFTGVADDLNGSVPVDAAGLWGGIILLGYAPNNNVSLGGVKSIEGIPTSETRGIYGGTNPGDNSGSLKYVSIRHSGSVIGANNEINGLTLASVGNGTTIENIEVIGTLDDGFEMFGGTVNVKNIIISLYGDDGLDTDEGYYGAVQNYVVWQTTQTTYSSDPRGGEWDGGVDADEEAQPYAKGIYANMTIYMEDNGSGLQKEAFLMRDNASVQLYNSIIVGHKQPASVEYRADKHSSFDFYMSGDLKISNNLFYDVNGVTSSSNFASVFLVKNENGVVPTADETTFINDMTTNNTFVDPGFGSGTAKFTPSAPDVTTNLKTGLSALNPFLQDQNYKGAVDPNGTPFYNWTLTWKTIQ